MGNAPRRSHIKDIQTKSRLLKASLIEFSQKGYYLTNADAITKRAKVGHGTFYLYFKNKNDALIELMQQLGNQSPYIAYQKDHKYLMRHTQHRDEFEAIILEMVKPLTDNTGLLKAFMQGMMQDKEVFTLAIQIGRNIARTFKVVTTSLQKKGGLRGCDMRILSEIMSVCLTTSILMMAMEIITSSPEILARNLCGIISPSLIHNKHQKKSAKLRMSIPENDAKIRRDLLLAAKEEFIEHGYFATKITNITKKAGYSRGTFYLYYKDKDDLLEDLFFDMEKKLNPQANSPNNFIDALDITSIEDLVRTLTEIVNVFDTPMNLPLLQGFFNSPKLNRIYKEIFALYGDPVMQKIVALQAKGQCSGIEPPVASQIILATVSYTAFLRNVGVIDCTKRKCAINLAWFLYNFVNNPS